MHNVSYALLFLLLYTLYIDKNEQIKPFNEQIVDRNRF